MKIFKNIRLITATLLSFALFFNTGSLVANSHDKALRAIHLNEIKKLTIELSSDKFEGRATDTYGNRQAARYIDSVLIKIGYTPIRQNFYNNEISKNISNIITRIEGKDTNAFIIIGAHYDHLGIKEGEVYHGADDNMSGVAAVMTLARIYRNIYKEKQDKTGQDYNFRILGLRRK